MDTYANPFSLPKGTEMETDLPKITEMETDLQDARRIEMTVIMKLISSNKK